MSIRLLCRIIAVLALSSLCANAQDRKVERPPGPLIQAKAPEYSQWMAIANYTTRASEAELATNHAASLERMAEGDPVFAKLMSQGSVLGALPKRIQKKVFIKTGDIRVEKTVFSNESVSERWVVKDRTVIYNPFSGRIIIRNMGADTRDFLEFAWISEKNFKEIRSFKGRDCLVFEARVHPVQISDPRSFIASGGMEILPEDMIDARAFVDLDTRFPLGLEAGEQQWTYEMQSAPVSKLELPTPYQKALNAANMRARSRNSTLSAP